MGDARSGSRVGSGSRRGRRETENSLAVQWLGLRALTAEGPGSIPVGELRSCKKRGAAKIKERRKEGRKGWDGGGEARKLRQ